MRDHNSYQPKKKLPSLVRVKLVSVVLAAMAALPESWAEEGTTKETLEEGAKVAAPTVTNICPKGTLLCASDLAKQCRGVRLDE